MTSRNAECTVGRLDAEHIMRVLMTSAAGTGRAVAQPSAAPGEDGAGDGDGVGVGIPAVRQDGIQ